ncbi:MAG: hypothetical protein WDN02_17925 [Methylovirgula sp.]|uniref:hypothetical protein n=1 Tax=Methylovirgula sp. TaxID=1978224 RepID=UPI0030761A22
MNPESLELKLAGFVVSVAGGIVGSCLSALIAGMLVVKFVLSPTNYPGPHDGLLLLIVLIVALISGFGLGKTVANSLWNTFVVRGHPANETLLGGHR